MKQNSILKHTYELVKLQSHKKSVKKFAKEKKSDYNNNVIEDEEQKTSMKRRRSLAEYVTRKEHL